MKDSADPPPPIDPERIADAQMRLNRQNALDNARLNRTNQSTPFGNMSWTTQTGPDGLPIYSSQITLPPEVQQLLDQQRQQQLQRSGLGQQYLNQVNTSPLDFSALPAVYDRYASDRQWTGMPQRPPTGQTPTGQPQMGNYQAINPLMRSSPPMGGAGPLANAVRSGGSTPPTPQIPQQGASSYDEILGGRNPYGELGSSVLSDGLTQEQVEQLPEWLQSQYRRISGTEGNDFYRLEGGLRNRQGDLVMQTGDASAAIGEGDNSVIDMSRVRYDPDLGMVTDPENRRSIASSSHRTGSALTTAAILAAGGYAGMQAMGLGGGAGAGAGAEGMAIDPSLLGSLEAGGGAGMSGAIDPALLGGLEAGGGASINPSLLGSIGPEAFAGGAATGTNTASFWSQMLRNPNVMRALISILTQPRQQR